MALRDNGEAYIKDMTDMSDPPDPTTGHSEIAQFFSGLKVLVTGGSGFMGKLLIEKLLRSCPNIVTLYVFMRAKKGKSAEERFSEHFDDILYVRLKKEQPDFAKKVVWVQADTAEADLGLSPENRALLQDTNVIFHGAATVRFDESLREAGNINVRGTKQLVLFATQLPNLKAFVHISTAFSHCVRKFIDEKFYEPPMDVDKLLILLDILNDKELEHITPTLLGDFPNTYAFTKAVAEDAVRRYSTGIPTCIVRPSIVIATHKDPIESWINNLYGPTGVVAGVGIGLLRSLHCDAKNVADIIPADYVIGNIIAAAWDIGTPRDIPQSITDSESDGIENEYEGIPIYNSVSSCQKPITWGHFMNLNKIYGKSLPSVRAFWCYFFTLNRHLFVHNIFIIFLHLLPAAIVDILAFLTGRKPLLWKAYKKIHKFSAVISYFSTQQWRFKNDTVLKLWKRLNTTDRMTFHLNVSDLDWDEYFYHHIKGVRVYLLKDPIDTLQQARAKYKKFVWIHYTICTVISLLLLWGLVSLLSCLWSLCPLAN